MQIVKQLAHVCVLANDLAQTEHFYCTVLGLKKSFNFTRNGLVFGFYLDTGGRTWIEVFQRNQSTEAGMVRIDHLCLEVHDIDAAVQHLRAHGVEVTDPKIGVDETWQAWTRDPNGTRIELFAYTAKSAQFLGGDREANW